MEIKEESRLRFGFPDGRSEHVAVKWKFSDDVMKMLKE